MQRRGYRDRGRWSGGGPVQASRSPPPENPSSLVAADEPIKTPRDRNTVKLTRRDPTVELIGPKKGKTMAKNHIGTTTGNLAAARLHKLLHSCIPIAFSQTKYSGVQANPNVMN
ncbi:hypothetical protein Leryth_014082 [Lithospermum erythrorhizon]|nr:hypothetical protein Leryth_014082 [Lithospermum erythrorhizon]